MTLYGLLPKEFLEAEKAKLEDRLLDLSGRLELSEKEVEEFKQIEERIEALGLDK